MSAKF